MKRAIVAVLTLVLAAILFGLSACGTSQRVLVPLTEFVLDDAVMRVPASKDDKFVVLTIDDAPSSFTSDFADLLARHNVKATFFLHTDQIDSTDREAAVRRLAAEGHDLAHHMPADRSYADDPQADFDEAFRRSHQQLALFADAHRLYFRPPQGAYKDQLMDPTLIDLGYDQPLSPLTGNRRYVLASFIPWDAKRGATDTDDAAYNRAQSDKYTNQLLANLYPGAIILYHDGEEDGRRPRAEAALIGLDHFIDGAKAQGYEVLSLSEAIERVSAQDK